MTLNRGERVHVAGHVVNCERGELGACVNHMIVRGAVIKARVQTTPTAPIHRSPYAPITTGPIV